MVTCGIDWAQDHHDIALVDTDGRLGMNWGVRGWPETFVVDGKGVIRFKYDEAALTPEVVRDQLLPAIEAAKRD